MRVRLTPRAYADREEIFNYLHSRSPSGARNVLASIRDALTQLSEQPHSGYATDEPNVRVQYLRYPYKIFYRVRDDAIEIIHIRHTARRPWRPF
jgi:toxin ParE1/3/4